MTEAALSSCVATLDTAPDAMADPQMAFAFCYIASHFGLGLLTDEEATGGVDSTGEAWDLIVDGMLLSPLTLRKRATKMELIKLVNGRKNKSRHERPYSEKSLSAKTFEMVFQDLADITV